MRCAGQLRFRSDGKISLFRHGKRNSFINLDTNETFLTDLCVESIPITIEKGRNFICGRPNVCGYCGC